MLEVAGPNPLRVRTARPNEQTVYGGTADGVVVTDGRTALFDSDEAKEIQRVAFQFSDHRTGSAGSDGLVLAHRPQPDVIASNGGQTAAAVADALNNQACAACGRAPNERAVIMFGCSIWSHATCIRPLLSAIMTPVYMFDSKDSFEFTTQPLSYPVNEQPVVCLRRTPFGGFTSSTYYSSEPEPELDSTDYYVNSSLVGVASNELAGYIDRLENPPRPNGNEMLAVRNGKAPYYLPDGLPTSLDRLPAPTDIFIHTEYDPDGWRNDWFLSTVQEALHDTSCQVCDTEYNNGGAFLLCFRNRAWCHRSCGTALARALNEAWAYTDEFLRAEMH